MLEFKKGGIHFTLTMSTIIATQHINTRVCRIITTITKFDSFTEISEKVDRIVKLDQETFSELGRIQSEAIEPKTMEEL